MPTAHTIVGIAVITSIGAFAYVAMNVPFLALAVRADYWHRTVVPICVALVLFAIWFVADPGGGLDWYFD